jgi:GcrA cell cycle regulator
MIKDSKWTEEMLAKLRDLYLNKDISTVEIANKLGFSKNAIIGKIHRMKLNEEKNNQNSSNDNINSKRKKISSDIKDSTAIGLINNNHSYERGLYPLEYLEYNRCAWPFGDEEFTFCGEASVYGKPYCQEHLNLVYLPHKKIAKKKDNVYVESSSDEIDIADEDIAEIDEA